MIPEGRYRARGCEGVLAETNNGSPQVAVDIVITEEGEHEGQHRTWYGHFTDKTTDRTLQSLRLLGWAGNDLSDLAGIDQNDVWVTIKHEEYEGQVRDRISFINASGGLAVNKPMDEGSAKAFAERMKGHVLAHKQKNGGGASTSASSPNSKPAAASGTSKAAGGGGGGKKTKKAAGQDFAPDQASDDDLPF